MAIMITRDFRYSKETQEDLKKTKYVYSFGSPIFIPYIAKKLIFFNNKILKTAKKINTLQFSEKIQNFSLEKIPGQPYI